MRIEKSSNKNQSGVTPKLLRGALSFTTETRRARRIMVQHCGNQKNFTAETRRRPGFLDEISVSSVSPWLKERHDPSCPMPPEGLQSGFTLIETMIAIIILSFGLLALASGFTQGMIFMSSSHQHRIAKEKASEAIESVSTARDTRVLSWAQIRNTGNSGIFLDGPQPVKTPGPDGLVNTSDDGSVESVTLPGPDGIMNTGDDVVVPLTGFTREIEIRDIAPNLRQIRVIVRYQMGHLSREYTLTSYISSFA